MSRLWDKGGSIEEKILEFTVGDDPTWDERLVAFDIRASIAHATMLFHRGYLCESERDRLEETLEEIGREHEKGVWSISRHEEDCHTAIENRLTQKLGDLGGRIHLGRSRNDQVMAALRLYLIDEGETIANRAEDMISSLSKLIETWGKTPMPGYTHLQRAMPSTIAAWAGAFANEIEDDRQGLLVSSRRLRRNPLGSAAGYGVPEFLQIDREQTAELLGFDEVQEPVTSVQLSRGKGEAHLAFELLLLMQDLGRLASDLCLFATEEFGFVELPSSMTTGSSIMPQKRNPDVFELVRGRSTQGLGELINILSLTLKMPSGYHRELQLIKPPLFRAIDNAKQTLDVMTYAMPRIRFRPERLEAAMSKELWATEEAYRLVVEKGMSFRDAYRRIGERYQAPSGSSD